jgi:uncharacterized cupredoxin-like copper-binding protein
LTSRNSGKRAYVIRGLGAVGFVSIATGLVLAAPTFGKGQSVRSGRSAKVTVITVTAGKPTELGFKLSRTSNIPAGKVEFKVTNGGLGFHDFKICTAPTTGATKNSCVGQVTKILHPKQTATLTVTLTKTGEYEFLCSVTGHAAAGMKGLLGIGVAVTKTSTSASTSSGSTTSTGSGSSSAGGTSPTTGSYSGPDISADPVCASGTVKSNGNSDGDEDELGNTSDGDGCL